MKPRVLMVISNFWPVRGGAEVQCKRLATKLAQLGYDVTVVTSRVPADAPGREDLDGVRVVRLGLPRVPKLKNLCFLLKVAWTLLRRGRSYDVVHAHQALRAAAVAVLMARLLRKPIIVKVSSGGDGFDVKRMKTRMIGDGFSLLDPFLAHSFSGATRMVAISSEIRSDLERAGIRKERIVDIPNGLDVSPAPVIVQERVDSDAPIRVLCVAGLRPLKGVDVLVDAAQATNGILFDVVGDGPEGPSLRELARRRGVEDVVVFRGRDDHPEQYFESSDISVFPSRAEGMSNALLEAMAAGMPCVATAVGGNVDMVEHDVSGVLIPPEDPTALAAALVELAGDAEKRSRLGRAARQTVEKRYVMATVTDKYAALYEDLVGVTDTSDEPTVGRASAMAKQPTYVRRERTAGFTYEEYAESFGLRDLCSGKDCLDAGGGDGSFSEVLLGYKPRSVSLFDINEERVRVAAERFAGLPNVRVAYGDIYDPPFDQQFDVVVCYSVLLLVNASRAIRALADMTKAGGYVFVTHHLPGYWFWRLARARYNPRRMTNELSALTRMHLRGRGVTTESRFIQMLRRHFQVLEVEVAGTRRMKHQVMALCRKAEDIAT